MPESAPKKCPAIHGSEKRPCELPDGHEGFHEHRLDPRRWLLWKTPPKTAPQGGDAGG